MQENKKLQWIVGGIVLAVVLVLGVISLRTEEKTMDTQNTDSVASSTVVLKTSMGDVEIELFADKAPKTVANFLKLSGDKFYDGTRFHRLIPEFMIQGGDPLSKDDSQKDLWGTGGPGYSFEDEINDVLLTRGVLAMANSGPNTNGSQFFIIVAEETPWLDGAHTAFGRVTSGMDVVDSIVSAPTEGPDRPIDDIVVESIEVL